MILLVAPRLDTAVTELQAAFAPIPVLAMTSRDLSREGWEIWDDDFENSQFIANEIPYRVRQLTGMISVLPRVLKEELVQIREEDQDYVYAEMNAFLMYFLHRLPCPKINAPQGVSLIGGGFRPEKWLQLASHAGFATEPISFRTESSQLTSPSADSSKTQATYFLGGEVWGDKKKQLNEMITQFATSAGLVYACVYHQIKEDQILFQGINCCPDLTDQTVLQQLVSYFAKA